MALTIGKWLGDIFKQEVPTGAVNGSNVNFTLGAVPHSDDGVILFLNGLPQILGVHWSLSAAQTITFTTAPATGQNLYVWYIKREE
jgi:hypothetical protein